MPLDDPIEGALLGAFRVEEVRMRCADIATWAGPMPFARLIGALEAAGSGEARVRAFIAGISHI